MTILLRSSLPEDIMKAHNLDKLIKTEFRSNVDSLRADLGDRLKDQPYEKQTQLMSRAMKVTSTSRPFQSLSVNPDKFTGFMKSLLPRKSATPKVQVKHFTVPGPLLDIPIDHIENGLKQHKAPGPDLIRLELLQIDPKLLRRAIMSDWYAVGRLAFVPSVLRRGTLSPYKK